MRPLLSLSLWIRAGLTGLALLAAGCSHYHLGSPQTPAFQTAYVAPVVNESFAPQAAGLVAAQVRAALSTDGRVQVGADGSSDVTIAVKLLSYSREVAAARRDDTGLARKFAVTLRAEVSVADRSGKKLIERRPVQVTRDVFTDSGQQPAEYQNLQLLAEALAQEVVHTVFDRW